MSQGAQRQLVVLHGVIEREDDDRPTPEIALSRLLASHWHAPGLLSEARHWFAVARDSALAATRVLRAARDSEVAYEMAHRKADPRGVRQLHFWPAAVCLGFLLTVCAAAALLLASGLPWPERITLALAAAIIGGVIAWRVSASQSSTRLNASLMLVGTGLCAVLMAIRIATAAGPLLLRVGEAAVLGLVLAAAVLASIFVLRHAEGWRCSRLRRASTRARRDRQDALVQAAADDSSAQAAMAAWESLVVEECQLAHPGPAASEAWLAECVAAARRLASPENTVHT